MSNSPRNPYTYNFKVGSENSWYNEDNKLNNNLKAKEYLWK